MVKTSDDVMDVHPLERMDKLSEITDEKRTTIATKKKELEELEKKKKKEREELDKIRQKQTEEFEGKKKKDLEELEKKKKELEELEKKKAQEIEETEVLIEKSFQDLMRHKRLLIAEEEELNKKSKPSSKPESLEEVARAAKEFGTNQPDYNKIFETLNAPKKLYDITNGEFYNNLTELRDKAARGEITPAEERFVEQLRDQVEKFNENPYNRQKDENQYMKRSLNVLDQIEKYHGNLM